MLDATIAGLEPLDAVGRRRRSAPPSRRAAVTAGLVNAEGQPQLSKAQGPVRVATTGRSVGPPLFESLEALGQERTLDAAAGGAGAAVTAVAGRGPAWADEPRDRAGVVGPVAAAAVAAPARPRGPRRARAAGRPTSPSPSSRCTGPAATTAPAPADAIIVLGAAQYDGRPSPVLQDRLDHALELYEAGLADHDRAHRRPPGGRPLHRGDRGLQLPAATRACPTRRSSRRSTAPAPGSRCGRRPASSSTATSTDGRARDRRLPRLPGGGDRRGHRPRRHRVARRTRASSGTGQLRQLARETAAVAVGRIIGYDRLFRIDHAVND